MDVKPNYCSLETVFSENTLYEVPMFQRAYSWKADNVNQFTSDIESLYQKFKSGNSEDTHFLGGIVCVKLKNDDVLDEKTIYQLVDGQQRLSTTVLVVSRLIVYLKSLKLTDEQSGIRERRIEKYRNKYIEFKSEENGKDILFSRIWLSRRDRDFYHSFVIKNIEVEPTLESHKLIYDAAKKIDVWLKTIFSNCKVEEVLTNSDFIFRVLSSACRILMIKMSDVNDAYKLFQVINDRGRSLTAGDLLRAASLGSFDSIKDRKESDLQDLEKKWDYITKDDSNSTNNKLIAYYTSKTAGVCRKTSLFEEFNRFFFSDPIKVKSNVENLYSEVILYERIQSGAWPYENSILAGFQKRKLENITVLFKHTHAIPMLMAASKLKEKKFYQIVFFLEKFFFIFRVALENRMDPVTKLYHQTIADINKNKDIYQVKRFVGGLKEIIRERVNVKEFDAYLSSLNYSQDGDNRNLKYLLSNIEENWRWISSENNNPAMLYRHSFGGFSGDGFVFSIEHIYPKKAKANDVDEKMEPHKNSLGNLTISYNQDNSSYENSNFMQKKAHYGASRLNFTIELSQYEKFELEELLSRFNVVSARLKKVFFLGEFNHSDEAV